MASTDVVKELSESFVKSSMTPDDTTFKTIFDCVKHYAITQPDKEAFVFVGTEGSREVVTWVQLYDNSVRAARGFMHLGVKRHDVVAVNVRNCPDWLYINFGIILARAIITHVSFAYKDGSDIVPMMEKLGTCSTIILDTGVDDNWNIFIHLVEEHSVDGTIKSAVMPNLKYLVVLDRPKNTPDLKTVNDILTDSPPSVELPVLGADDVITLFETSGSTGVPKLVAHTHTTMLAFCTKVNSFFEHCAVDNIAQNEEESGKDVFDRINPAVYNDRPLFWLGGWPNNVQNGKTRVTPSGLQKAPTDDIAFTFDVIKREKCVLLITLPSLLHAMLERKREIGPEWPVKCVSIGGQPATKDVAGCIGSLCITLSNAYGGTEFGMVSKMVVDEKDDFEDYSCGHLLPGIEIKIVDENKKIVPVGVSGEIYVRSNQMFQQYWNDPEMTTSVLSADGWFKTDDMGRMSKEGTLYVEGRKSDMIISGNLNLPPAVLENDIKTCPDVAAVMVVPIPHPSLYQAVCACVIPVTGSDVTEEALRRYCESIHNDQYSVLPKYYLIFEKFPQTKSGKVSRKELAIVAEKLLKRV